MTKPNDFDDFETEEAARRAATFDAQALREKSQAEQAKHDAGVGVEDGTEDEDEDEDLEEFLDEVEEDEAED